MAAVGGAVGVGPLLGAQIAAVDGGVAVFPELREGGDVQQVGRALHCPQHALQHLHLARVHRARIVGPNNRNGLAEAVLGRWVTPFGWAALHHDMANKTRIMHGMSQNSVLVI